VPGIDDCQVAAGLTTGAVEIDTPVPRVRSYATGAVKIARSAARRARGDPWLWRLSHLEDTEALPLSNPSTILVRIADDVPTDDTLNPPDERVGKQSVNGTVLT
jgi:hypothetical protein